MDVAWRESRTSRQPFRRACGFYPGWFPGPMSAAFASRPVFPWPSPLREADNAAHGLEASNRNLAQAAGARTPPSASARDPASRGELHGNGERAGERAIHPRPAGTQNPAARPIATTLGVVSHAQPASRLAERTGRLTSGIAGPCGRSLKCSIVADHRLAAVGTRHDETRAISRRPQAGENIEKSVIPANAGIQVRTLLGLRPDERSRRWGESCAQKYFFPYPRTVSGFKTVALHNPSQTGLTHRSNQFAAIK